MRVRTATLRLIVVASLWALPLIGCVAVPLAAQTDTATRHEIEGYASWYAGKFQGRLTANGEVFDTNQLTAAHKTLPFGTVVEVTHLGNGRSVTVRINDRGPFVDGRVIDLSRAAAEAIEMTAEGIGRVRLSIVSVPAPPTRRIQVASFSSRSNADLARDRLRANGIDARIEPAGTVYRVVIPGLAESTVQDNLDRLEKLGYRDVLVRTE